MCFPVTFGVWCPSTLHRQENTKSRHGTTTARMR